jgi:hypothetical protein
MRARLAGPFLWSAEQAIEKYLKCILMLNRLKTQDLGHDIQKALWRINSMGPFQIKLRGSEQAVFDHIGEWGGDRYLISSFTLRDIEVLQLDMLVWKLRQYCTPLDVVHYADDPSQAVLKLNINRIEAGLTGAARSGLLDGGLLEAILHDKKHAARPALIWKNLRFNLVARRGVKFVNGIQGVNAPLWLDPDLADQVAEWMYIPKQTLSAARRLSQDRARK